MKTVLLYANEDVGFESRLEAALDVARAFDGHIACVQATPFESYVVGDPFGGVYALTTALDAIRDAEDAHRRRVEARLASEGISWDWLRYDGAPALAVADRSSLCDLVVLSLPGRADGKTVSMLGETAIKIRAPVLAMPQESRALDCFGPAVMAWNGSPEAAHALRLTVPMLARASLVHIVTVTEEKTGFPATDACEFLSRHGIASELREWVLSERSVAEALFDAAQSLKAGYVAMGAYGHSRLRETALGGTTREMILRGSVPLLLAH